MVVLTGAGCSTESGIPDYRGPHGRYRREDFVPLTYQVFSSTDNEKRRYWARSMLGYKTMLGASCNDTHLGLHALGRAGVVSHILTQNVDGLHHLATYGGQGDTSPEGFHKYIVDASPQPYQLTEIHGNIHQVICMDCKHVIPRALLQDELRRLNPSIYDRFADEAYLVRPDGDFNAPTEAVAAMRLVTCSVCGGHLKPHVVLFGENVPLDVARTTVAAVKASSCLVCLGTSLQVFSAYRYVLAAKDANVPVVIVNDGKTRGDGEADLKIETNSTAIVIRETVQMTLGSDAF